MLTDDVSRASNVVRFPVEEVGRPTLELMRALAPDLRTVDMVTEAYGLELPEPDFRGRVDAEAAEHILNHVDDDPGVHRLQQLNAMLEPVVRAAVEAARASRRAWGVVTEGRRQLARAKREGGFWLEGLEQQRDARERQAAEATVTAHLRAEEAEGVARAVSLARSGQAWSPRNVAAEMDVLLGQEAAAHAVV
jgi:hypothetical protein